MFTVFRSHTDRRSRSGAGLIYLAALAAAGLIVAGCGSEEASGDAADAARTGARSLVIYTYDAFPQALETMIMGHFQEVHGFSPTMERFPDTGGLYNQLWLEREAPRADVAIGLDNTYVGRALEAGLFQPYRPAEADAILPHLVIDPDFRLTPFDWGHIVLNYDSEQLPDPPTTWEELLDPRLSESIILLNPATSSPGRNFLLFTIAVHGEEGYLDYWRRLSPNILTVTAGWSEGYGLYTQGEASIVLSYETSPAYHIEYERTNRYRTLILDGQGYLQVEVAGISAGARNTEDARLLIDYLLSEELQAEIPLNQFMYPVREGVALPPAFEQLERADESVFIPVDEVDAGFDSWLAAWRDVMR